MRSLLVLPAIALLLCCLLLGRATSTSETEEDQDPRCKEWAEAGECTANAGYMLQSCAHACHEVQADEAKIQEKLRQLSSFYDLSSRDIDGNVVKFEEFRGKVVVIANVASQCGYTESHYRGLVQLFENVKDGGTEILAFPCNQFGRQEPGSADEIKSFAASKGVKFRMMEKVDVNGAGADLVYLYLKDQAGISSITWNFATYFVVSPDGDVESYTGVEPMDLSNVVRLLQNKEEL